MYKVVADYSALEGVALWLARAVLNRYRLLSSDLLHVSSCVINTICSLFV